MDQIPSVHTGTHLHSHKHCVRGLHSIFELIRWKILHQFSQTMDVQGKDSLRSVGILLGRNAKPYVPQGCKQSVTGQKKNPYNLSSSTGLQPEEGEEKAVITFITVILLLTGSYKQKTKGRMRMVAKIAKAYSSFRRCLNQAQGSSTSQQQLKKIYRVQ